MNKVQNTYETNDLRRAVQIRRSAIMALTVATSEL